jgi:hypothetical protein
MSEGLANGDKNAGAEALTDLTRAQVNTRLSVEKGFALMLEAACEDFETMQRLISGELSIVSRRASRRDWRAAPCVQMALAKSFVFNLARARRICEHGASSLTVDRAERKRFLAATAEVLSVRNVNEHGFDVATDSPPSLHFHAEGGGCDETSLVIDGPDSILMGPLNLAHLHKPTDRMRQLAGFSALSERDRRGVGSRPAVSP